MYKQTFGLVLIDFVIWLSFLWINRRFLLIANNTIPANYKSNKHSYVAFFVFVSSFCTFSYISGDYAAYLEIYNTINIKNTYLGFYLEPFYIWLIDILPHNYSIWRYVVWGLSSIAIIKTFKRLDFSIEFSSLIFCLLLFVYFSTPRNSLGYVVLYLGATYLFFPSTNKKWSYFVGIVLVVCSNFLHKSMFLYIIILLFSLIPFGKRSYIFSLIFFPIIYKSITFISRIILEYSFANAESQERGMEYLESDFQVRINAFGYLHLGIWRVPLLFLLYYAIKNIYFKGEEIPYGYKVFLNYSYLLIYMALLFTGQEVSAFLSTRFYDASIYTLTIFFAYYLYRKPLSKFIKTCMYTFIVANLYNFFLAFYKLF